MKCKHYKPSSKYYKPSSTVAYHRQGRLYVQCFDGNGHWHFPMRDGEKVLAIRPNQNRTRLIKKLCKKYRWLRFQYLPYCYMVDNCYNGEDLRVIFNEGEQG